MQSRHCGRRLIIKRVSPLKFSAGQDEGKRKDVKNRAVPGRLGEAVKLTGQCAENRTNIKSRLMEATCILRLLSALLPS